MSRERFEELTERLEAGVADAAEQRELAALLEGDATLRRRLVEESLGEVHLRKVLAGAAAAPERPVAPPVWRVALWSAAAAVLVFAGGYVLWQMQAGPAIAPRQAYVPMHLPDIQPIPPPPPEGKGAEMPQLEAGRLLVDGVEGGAIQTGSVLANPEKPSGLTTRLEVLHGSILELAPGTEVTWLPNPEIDGTAVRLKSGRLTFRNDHIGDSLQVEVLNLRIEDDSLFHRPAHPGEIGVAFTVELSGSEPHPEANQVDRRKVTVTVTKGQVEITGHSAAAGVAAKKEVIPSGERRTFKAKNLMRPFQPNHDDVEDDEDEEDEDEEDDVEKQEHQEEQDLGHSAVPPSQEF